MSIEMVTPKVSTIKSVHIYFYNREVKAFVKLATEESFEVPLFNRDEDKHWTGGNLFLPGQPVFHADYMGLLNGDIQLKDLNRDKG